MWQEEISEYVMLWVVIACTILMVAAIGYLAWRFLLKPVASRLKQA